MRSTPFRSAATAFIATACLLHADAVIAARVVVRSGGAPVAGCVVVLAEEGRLGPYRTLLSSSDGTLDIADSFSGTLLLLHPGHVPHEASAKASRIELTAGTPVPAQPPGAALRVYRRSWIGRFDVETLPALPSNESLSCNAPDVVFDLHIAGKPRVLAQGKLPDVPSAATTTVNIRPKVADAGFVYLAARGDATDALPRSRAVAAGATATFEDVPVSPHVVVVALNRYRPLPIAIDKPAPTIVTAEPRAGMTATGAIRCQPVVDSVAVRAELRLPELPAFAIPRAVQRTDSSFAVAGLGPGEMIVAAAAPEHRDDARRVLVSDERQPIEIGALCPGDPFVIQGIVLSGGKALEGAGVSYGASQAKTDRAGRFALRTVAPPAAPLEVTRQGFLPWKRWYVPSAAAPALSIALQRGIRLRGSVVDATTRKAVPRFQITVLPGDEPGKLLEQRVTSDAGTFRTPLVEERAATILIEADSYQPAMVDISDETPVDKASGDRDLGELTLTPAPAVIGRVLDDRGEPHGGAVVRLRDAALPEWTAGRRGYSLFETTTAPDGTFRLASRSKPFTLQVQAAGFAPFIVEDIVPSETLDVGNVSLSRGCVVEGKVIARGAGVNGLTVELHRGSADSKDIVSSTTTDDEGLFTFRGVAEGDQSIVVRTNKRRLADRTVVVNECDDIASVEIEVGKTRVFGLARKSGNPLVETTLSLLPASEVDSPRLTVIRRRIDEEGRNVTDEILGRGASAIITQTDATGFFEFRDVAPGPYQISMSIGDGVLARTITVPDADVMNVSVDFGGRSIAGAVIDAATQAPIAGAVLTLNADRARTDALGRFELDMSEATTGVLAVAAEGYEKKSVPIDATTSTLHVQLERARIRVTGIVSTGSSPASTGIVRWLLHGPAGQSSGATHVREDGSFEIDHLAPGRLMLAVYALSFGLAVETIDLTASDTERTANVRLSPPATLRVRLPPTATPDRIMFLRGGTSVTPLLWLFPELAPSPAGDSEWLWTFLGAGTFELVIGNRRGSVQLIPGSESLVTLN